MAQRTMRDTVECTGRLLRMFSLMPLLLSCTYRTAPRSPRNTYTAHTDTKLHATALPNSPLCFILSATGNAREQISKQKIVTPRKAIVSCRDVGSSGISTPSTVLLPVITDSVTSPNACTPCARIAMTPATRQIIPTNERLEMDSRSRKQLMGYTIMPLIIVRAVLDSGLPVLKRNYVNIQMYGYKSVVCTCTYRVSH